MSVRVPVSWLNTTPGPGLASNQGPSIHANVQHPIQVWCAVQNLEYFNTTLIQRKAIPQLLSHQLFCFYISKYLNWINNLIIILLDIFFILIEICHISQFVSLLYLLATTLFDLEYELILCSLYIYNCSSSSNIIIEYMNHV